MNRMVAGKNGVRHGRGHYAEGAEFDASDVDAKYYEDRGMASRKQAVVPATTTAPAAPAEPAPRRRGRPPIYQTRQMTAEKQVEAAPAQPATEARPMSTADFPPENTQS